MYVQADLCKHWKYTAFSEDISIYPTYVCTSTKRLSSDFFNTDNPKKQERLSVFNALGTLPNLKTFMRYD